MSDLKVEIIKVGEGMKEYTKTVIDRNSAICSACGDEVESKTTHHFAICKCGGLFVDGGKDYLRRGGGRGASKDTSLTHEEPREKYEWEE